MSHSWSPGMYTHAGEFGSVYFKSPNDTKLGYIDFQDGPISEQGVNGVQIEEIIDALVERLEALNTPPFTCRENSVAITKLQEARMWLEERTRLRTKRGIEGTRAP